MRLISAKRALIGNFLIKDNQDAVRLVIKKAKRELGHHMRQLVPFGGRPIKGTYSEQWLGQLEDYDAQAFQCKCYFDAPFLTLLRAKRAGVQLPIGGKERRIAEVKEWLSEFGDEDMPERLSRWRRIYGI